MTNIFNWPFNYKLIKKFVIPKNILEMTPSQE